MMPLLRFIWRWVLPVWGLVALVLFSMFALSGGVWIGPNFTAASETETTDRHIQSPNGRYQLTHRQRITTTLETGRVRQSDQLFLSSGAVEASLVGSLHGSEDAPAGMIGDDPRFDATWIADDYLRVTYCGVSLTGVSTVALLPDPESPDATARHLIEIETVRRPDCDLPTPDPYPWTTIISGRLRAQSSDEGNEQ